MRVMSISKTVFDRSYNQKIFWPDFDEKLPQEKRSH